MNFKNKLSGISKKRHFKPLFVIFLCCLSLSWSSKTPNTTLQNEPILINASLPTSTIVLETCFFTKDQLKTLLIADVRKIILQFQNDASSKTILVAYGADKDNKVLSGPVYSTIVPGSAGISIPKDGILGNLIVRRGQLKELFGHREGKHERIDETKITDIVFQPQATLKDDHVWYNMNTHTLKRLLVDLPANPCPPAKPCEDCENFGNDN